MYVPRDTDTTWWPAITDVAIVLESLSSAEMCLEDWCSHRNRRVPLEVLSSLVDFDLCPAIKCSASVPRHLEDGVLFAANSILGPHVITALAA